MHLGAAVVAVEAFQVHAAVADARSSAERVVAQLVVEQRVLAGRRLLGVVVEEFPAEAQVVGGRVDDFGVVHQAVVPAAPAFDVAVVDPEVIGALVAAVDAGDRR